MITLIHGDDTAASRTFFLSEKQKIKNAFSFDGKKLTLTDLVQALEGSGFFDEEEKTLFIEDLISARKESAEKQKLESFLSKRADSARIYLWENKDVSKAKSPLVKKATSRVFNFPKTLFTFLDSIYPGSKSMTKNFHQALETVEDQMLFTMLIRQIRLLVGVTYQDANAIDEVARLAPWQASKLQKQASYFRKGQLEKVLQKLFEIDLASKTGGTSLTLTQSIDFLLLSL